MVSFGPISLSLWAYRNLFLRNCLNDEYHWSWSVHKFGGHVTSYLWTISLIRTACYSLLWHLLQFPGGSEVKVSACNAGDLGLIPGSGRSPGEGNGNPLQYSCLEATVHRVAKSRTRLSDFTSVQFSSVQLLSCVWFFATPWTAGHQASLSITSSWSPPKPISTESVMPSNHLILCHPLLILPSVFPSIRVFSNESTLWIRWPKYWSFSFSISPSNEHPGLSSFRMNWLDLLAVQGTLKSLLQHHSLKASIFWHSTLFIVQLSHLYTTTGKTIALLDGPLLAKYCLCFWIRCLG